MTEEEQSEADLAVVRKHVAELGEHFESVQVFVTRHCGEYEGTMHCEVGYGNWYTRMGQVVQWMKRNDARDEIKVAEEED